MRVISQNGEFDFPYEQIAVSCSNNQVACRLFADQKNCIVLGVYSTDEKAQKAMEMLRNEYESACYCNDGFDSAAQIQRPYLFRRNTVFQFPSEEDI